MFNKSDKKRNKFMLTGSFAKLGYDWWWHSFTAKNEKTGEEKAFFIEFFTCNPSLKEAFPVLGQASQNKEAGKRPSYVLVKAGAWGEEKAQLHKFFPWKSAKIGFDKKAGYSVQIGDFLACETQLKGSLNISREEAENHPEYMCDFGSMEWDLKLEKKVAFNVGYGASWFLRAIKAFEMYWHAEGMKTLYSGSVTFNGQKYIVTPESSFGYADKNWGRDFTSPWVWLSSNNLTSKLTGKKLDDSVFDIGGGRPKIGFVSLNRKLLSAFLYEGREFEFNFSKFWTFTRTKFNCQETENEIVWFVEQKTWRNKMITKISCKKKDMILVNYEAPDGTKRHNRLWNGGNGEGTIALYRDNVLIDEIIAKNVGCEYGEYDK